MTQTQKVALLDKIRAAERIVIMRHKRPDGDAEGSALGLRAVLRESYPEKDVRVINDDTSNEVAFLGAEDGAADPTFYEGALGIVLDSAVRDRIANPCYQICRELIKIDHHIPVDEYGDLVIVDERASSVCQMVADFVLSFPEELRVTREAARCLYAGMVTDSGRFRFESVTGDTLRTAGALLDVGIDTEAMFSSLYLGELRTLKFRAWVFENMNVTENGVLWLHITTDVIARFGITQEEASLSVNEMSMIRGSMIWLACIDNGDGSSRVRLRSRHVTINTLAERYSGGGHAHASGATVHSAKELSTLVCEADEILKSYRAENPDKE